MPSPPLPLDITHIISIIDSFYCVSNDKIPDLKKESICSIQFYCSIINMMFPVQILISFNAKMFNRICGIELFTAKVNLDFTVFLLSLMFKLPTQFSAHLERSYLHLTNELSFSYQDLHCHKQISLHLNIS